MYNQLYTLKETLSLDDDIDTIKTRLNLLVKNVSFLYSYFVGRKDDDIIIRLTYSEYDQYNTIDAKTANENIITCIIDYLVSLSNAKCIAFGQPPLELILELYQPMLNKMAQKIKLQWRRLEIEDLVSIANYLVVKLYKQGYYINKWLVWTSLNNEVLMELRDCKHPTELISLEDILTDGGGSDEALTYGDIVKDPSYEEEAEREDYDDCQKYILEEVKKIAIEKIGERQWDRLYRDYSKGHTSAASQQSMKRIKNYIKSLGLTKQDFINHYRR